MIKRVLKKTPVLGYIAAIALMPGRIEQLMTSHNISYENMISSHESTIHRINEIQAFNHHFLCEFISKTDSDIKCMNDMLDESSLKVEEINRNTNSRILKLQGGLQEINDKIIGLQDRVADINDEIQEKHDNIEKRFTSIGAAFDCGIKNISACTKDMDLDIKAIGDNLKQSTTNTMNELGRLFKNMIKPSYLNMYAPSFELEFLKQSNITLIEGLVGTSGDDVHTEITVVGHYAREVFEDVNKSLNIRFLKPVTLETMICGKSVGKENGMVVPEAIPHSIDRQDKIIVLNPAVAAMLVTENRLQELAMKIKSELILVLGKNNSENLSVAWGEGFSGIECSENGDFFRWYSSAMPSGTIQILNNTRYRMNCTINFSVIVLDTQSQTIIHIGTSNNVYNMENGFVEITEQTVLIPGVNTLSIEFCGKSIQPAADPRYLKFAVKGFNVVCKTDTDIQFNVYGAEAYKKQTLIEGTVSMPPDELVRSSLHLNGFFEVENFLCSSKLDTLLSGGQSRYCEANQAYRFIKQSQNCEIDGMNIYIAKRRGKSL
jgi:hypothetical protein